MELLSFFGSYFFWHYTRALKDLIGIIRNCLWFLYHFFSIEILLKTFFSPWRRMKETYRKGFYLGEFFSSFFINTMMRLIGMGIRTGAILLGIVSLAGAVLLGIVVFVGWLALPFFITLLLYQGTVELLPSLS